LPNDDALYSITEAFGRKRDLKLKEQTRAQVYACNRILRSEYEQESASFIQTLRSADEEEYNNSA
jgi:hypothetical protein